MSAPPPFDATGLLVVAVILILVVVDIYRKA